MHRLSLPLLFLLLTPLARARDHGCHYGEGSYEKQLGRAVLKITPAKDNESGDEICRATIRDERGDPVFEVEDMSITVDKATGEFVSNELTPDLVLAGYSGGAHCCFTYWVISFSSRPELVVRLENAADIVFFRTHNHIFLRTQDGAFDYFDDISHASTPWPTVYARLAGNRLVDVGRDFAAEYDKDIREARSHLDAREIKAFRAAAVPRRHGLDFIRIFSEEKKSKEEEEQDDEAMKYRFRFERTKSQVLTIVLSYLYSGREDLARRTLVEMWPPSDIDRIWKLIRDTRDGGFVRNPTPRRDDE